MKVALIGVGRIGQLHARSLAALPEVDELLVADVEPGRAASVVEGIAATVMASLDAALAEADAVVIATPTDSHAAMIRSAIGRGLPTFCEKPLAIDLAESIALGEDIEASGVPFQLGFQRRFDPAYLEARRLISSGEMGTLYLVSLASHDPAPPSDAYIASSGGIFRDLSIHDLDILRFLTGMEVDEVHAQGAIREHPQFGSYGDVEIATATLRLEDGLPVILSATRHDPLGHDVRTEIFGSRDSVVVGLGPKMPLRSLEPGVPPPSGPAWRIFLDRWEGAYRAELAGFMRVARGEAGSPCTAGDGVAAMRIAEAMTISLQEHRMVALSEIA